MLIECLNNLVLMLSPISFQRNPQFHCRIAVDGYELVMFQLDHIAALFGNDIRHSA